MFKSISYFLISSLFLMLTGCGGGSSSSGGAISVNIPNIQKAYSGSTDAAILDQNNYDEYVNTLFRTSGVSGNNFSRNGDQEQEITTPVFSNHDLFVNTFKRFPGFDQTTMKRAVSQTVTCSQGGSAYVTGNVDDGSLTGTLVSDYTNCQEDGITMNGQATMVIHSFNSDYYEIQTFTISYTDLNITQKNLTYKTTGSSYVNYDFSKGYGNYTSTDNILVERNGVQTMYENYVVTASSNDISITGKVYHPDHGYVTISTESPIRYYSNYAYPYAGGPVILQGASNQSLRLILQSGGNDIRVEMDFDGDDRYETYANMDSSGNSGGNNDTNEAPQIVISGDVTNVSVNSTVTLDASETSDENGDAITFVWTLGTKPEGSSAALSDSSGPTTSIIPDVTGFYEISLIAEDNFGGSSVSTKSFTVLGESKVLTHNIVDAVYDGTNNRLIVVTSEPTNTLRVINPETGETEQSVALPKRPTAVAINANDSTIGVGFDAWVGAYPRAEFSQGQVWIVPLTVGDIEVSNDGVIYLSPVSGTQWDSLYTSTIATQQTTIHSGSLLYAGAKIKIREGTQSLYAADNGISPSDIEKFDISTNPTTHLYDSPYHGDYAFSGNLWFTEEADYLLAKSGLLFKVSDQQAQDMLYAGNTSDSSAYTYREIIHADHSEEEGSFVVMRSQRDGYFDDPEYVVQVFSTPFLEKKSEFSLKEYSPDGMSGSTDGLFSFYHSTGEKYYILAKHNPTVDGTEEKYFILSFSD